MFRPAPFVSKTINDKSWKPQTSWIIILRREDGLKDVRSCKGTYTDAVKRRKEYMANSLYASAWIIEERDKSNFKPKPSGVAE